MESCRVLVFAVGLLAGCGPGASTPDAAEPGADAPAPDAPADARSTCGSDADCDDTLFCNGAERCLPSDPAANARGCVAGAPACAATERCLPMARMCVPPCDVDDDADGDGFIAAECDPGGTATDCDDGDPDVHPQPVDLCDAGGVDHDCDPSTPGDLDFDHDGAIDAYCFNEDTAGVETSRGSDCDDFDAARRPGASETCDGRDDDCDGTVDDGVTVAGYADLDGDGAGDPTAPRMACADAGRFVTNDDDCDDAQLLVRVDAIEICDGVDNDCDLVTDESPLAVPWYPDADGDGFGALDGGFVVSCHPVPGRSMVGRDCDDGAARTSPASAEVCNGLDDDCNGLADFVLPSGAPEDADRDGVASALCDGFGRDCDDRRPWTSELAPEICGNLVDDDCDARIDESSAELDWYPDVDGDGYGDARGTPMRSCAPLPARSHVPGDCDDRDPVVRPRVRDTCGLGDEDCDGTVDENAADRRTVFPDGDNDDWGAESGAVIACGPTLAGYGDHPRDCAPADPGRWVAYADTDGDGEGELGAEPLTTCTTTGVTSALDCDDADATVRTPSACVDLCDGTDDDGDGAVDEDGAMGCPNADATTWACTSGACVFGGCAPGGGDCNGSTADGCETDTRTDSLRCGSCTTTCDHGEACAMGICDDPIVDVRCGTSSTMAIRRSGAIVWWGHSGGRASTAATSSTVTFIPQVSLARDADLLEHRWRLGCAHGRDGVWRCWGSHAFGSTAISPVGDGVVGAVVVPRAPGVTDPLDFGLGVCHACAVRTNGTVVCWGAGGPTTTSGPALGDGSDTQSNTPVTVLGLDDATSVSAGWGFSCAVRATGHVICWGVNASGQLGDGSTIERPSPVRDVEALATSMPLTDAVDVVASSSAGAGFGTACALLDDATVACWGLNGDGQLGDGTTVASRTRAVPVVAGPGLTTRLSAVAELHGGSVFFCALHDDGAVSCWGRNDSGQLGIGSVVDQNAPVRVPLPRPALHISTGANHVCVLLDDERVFCWGDNADYQCSAETTADVLSPREVTSLYRGAP